MQDQETLKSLGKSVKELTTDQLKQEFANGLQVVRERLLRMAAIVAELDRRHEVIDGSKQLIEMFRSIASGSLLVDVVLRFAKSPRTLKKMANLTVQRQRALLGKSDDEIVKRLKGKTTCKASGLSLREMAEAGTPKDVADMCMELVDASSNPPMVASILMAMLQRKTTREAV